MILEKFKTWRVNKAITANGLFYGSRCQLGSNSGRFTCPCPGVTGWKPATYGQLALADRLGFKGLKRVLAQKDLANANQTGALMSVSHLCGAHPCANSEHVIVERKRLQETRKHCHYVLAYHMRKWDAEHPEPAYNRKRKRRKWRKLRRQQIYDWVEKYCQHKEGNGQPCCMPIGFKFPEDDSAMEE